MLWARLGGLPGGLHGFSDALRDRAETRPLVQGGSQRTGRRDPKSGPCTRAMPRAASVAGRGLMAF